MKLASYLFALYLVYSVILSLHICQPYGYYNYTTGNSKLCSPVKKNKFKLGGRNEEHGLHVTAMRTFDHWSGHKVFDCRFEVKGHGTTQMMAVIQKLAFRRDESGSCLDYVQFRSKSLVSKKYCGFIKLKTRSQEESLAANAFLAREDEKIDVIIFVANKTLQPNEELDLEIVFTAGQDCYVTPSTEYSSCGFTLCIKNEYFGDGLVNCPYIDCADEGRCIPSFIPGRRSNVGGGVTVGAVTTVLTSFLMFFACIWLSRRYHKLCWAADCRNGRAIHIPPEIRRSDHGEGGSQQRPPNPIRPLCPTNERVSAAPGIVPDKDLPPSYESLFPSR